MTESRTPEPPLGQQEPLSPKRGPESEAPHQLNCYPEAVGNKHSGREKLEMSGSFPNCRKETSLTSQICRRRTPSGSVANMTSQQLEHTVFALRAEGFGLPPGYLTASGPPSTLAAFSRSFPCRRALGGKSCGAAQHCDVRTLIEYTCQLSCQPHLAPEEDLLRQKRLVIEVGSGTPSHI